MTYAEAGMRVLGPVFAVGALTLISLAAFSFFEAVYATPFLMRTTPNQRLVHGVVGIWVTSNLYFNYLMCIFTKPGSSASLPEEVLLQSVPRQLRWCKKCNATKPPLSHHCAVCKECVLNMDHHCPWVSNCVGYRNYSYFYLFLFYLWLGCVYSFCVLSDRYAYRFAPKLFAHPTSIPQVHLAQKLTSILALMMSGGIAWAIGFMLFWHTYLVLTAQGTIDFYNNRMDAYEARQLGHTWINVYDNGCVQNWKHRFDVDGALWWIRWTLPRVRPRRGNGCVFPICVDPRRFAAQAV